MKKHDHGPDWKPEDDSPRDTRKRVGTDALRQEHEHNPDGGLDDDSGGYMNKWVGTDALNDDRDPSPDWRLDGDSPRVNSGILIRLSRHTEVIITQ